MASEQKHSDVGASNRPTMLRSSGRIKRQRDDDSRDDADRSTIQPASSRQQALYHSNMLSSRPSSVRSAISDETLESLMALGNELKKIRRRLITEGYVIEGNRIYKPNDNDLKN